MGPPPREPRGLFAYALLSVVVLGLVGLLARTDDAPFGRFLGALPPLGVFAAAAVLGGIGFATVLTRAGFALAGDFEARGWLRAAAAAAVFGGFAVGADFLIVFPRDLNLPLPRSLAFYPAIGFLVEILFHVVPLSVLLLPLAFGRAPASRDRLVWGALAATALLEPVYQALSPVSTGSTFRAAAFVAVHVGAINAVGLWLFRRYDFMTMYGFRLFYYLIWHIVWGTWRLEILF